MRHGHTRVKNTADTGVEDDDSMDNAEKFLLLLLGFLDLLARRQGRKIFDAGPSFPPSLVCECLSGVKVRAGCRRPTQAPKASSSTYRQLK